MAGGLKSLFIAKVQGSFSSKSDSIPEISIWKNLWNKKKGLDYSALQISWNQKLDDQIIYCAQNSKTILYNAQQEKIVAQWSEHTN